MNVAFINWKGTGKSTRSKEPTPSSNQPNRRLLCSTHPGVDVSPSHGPAAPLF